MYSGTLRVLHPLNLLFLKVRLGEIRKKLSEGKDGNKFLARIVF